MEGGEAGLGLGIPGGGGVAASSSGQPGSGRLPGGLEVKGEGWKPALEGGTPGRVEGLKVAARR